MSVESGPPAAQVHNSADAGFEVGPLWQRRSHLHPVKIKGLTRLAVATLAQCLTSQETAAVTLTTTTATFGLTQRQAIALVLRAQARHHDRRSAAAKSLDTVVSKLRALDQDPPRSIPQPLPFPELLHELDQLETQVARFLNTTPDHPQ